MTFRDLILTNFRRKLFALLLAVLVWLTIYFNNTDHRRLNSPSTSTNAAAIHP